mgnify:CR=1 FL=1
MEISPRTAIIIPEKIWEKVVDVKGSARKKIFIKYKNFIFSCFGSLPEGIKEGEKCQIEYDYNSKYVKEDEKGGVVFYNLIKPKVKISDVMDKLNEIEKKIDEIMAIQNQKEIETKKDSTFSPEDLKEEDIPTVEDEDTL